MTTTQIQARYAKKMFNQLIKEVAVKPITYEIVDANHRAQAVLISYQDWQQYQSLLAQKK
ncbi:type II toxin-antitoxin system Phd/YefM family antitoxin [Latilactobacillus fuchuensis]|jgi:PHD/YefM family antitoxin component YafN of YafNO toxin-antitoxin module|uniref:Antitoxin n=2 Tax=Latilactobacillus fuchuensis TaxID=164393 RepID=A0A2N9DT02_9LACO|nr:type II toxin-antitoxin system Phd/YefM family antitoxin [Latilactobacillus fuchuensis]KRL61998.1 hypothetical protein FC69_GL001208 [Latilactobacillus fuchuensis DSM 14340 = JCM 11249]MCP8856686.1 type II toxin-antitoxin system Phd/YefM family antitoxin [Latilactobacillus fuchuensis]SPC35883.1 conserved hypothetical protein [Latilactobacillus fuchuensis]